LFGEKQKARAVAIAEAVKAVLPRKLVTEIARGAIPARLKKRTKTSREKPNNIKSRSGKSAPFQL
jgi:hypothetical protein